MRATTIRRSTGERTSSSGPPPPAPSIELASPTGHSARAAASAASNSSSNPGVEPIDT
jgi:hypothetical protein